MIVRFESISHVVLHISYIAAVLSLLFFEEESFGAEPHKVIVCEFLCGLEMVATLLEKDSEMAGLGCFDRQTGRFSIIHFLFIYLESDDKPHVSANSNKELIDT